GRGWRGFHHHASLCIAAYGFLVSLRDTIPPSTPTRAQGRQTPGLPDGYRPRRSSDPTRAARPDLNPDHQATPDCGPGQPSATMSVLHKGNGQSA
ncbi:IS701 family transposase, partial [Mesorhizobium sp. M0323]